MAARFSFILSLLVLSVVYFAASTWLFDFVSKNVQIKSSISASIAISVSAVLILLYNRYIQKLAPKVLGFSMGTFSILAYLWFDIERILDSYSQMGIAVYVWVCPVILGYLINVRKT